MCFCLSLNQNSRTVSAEASRLREATAAAAKIVKDQEEVKAGPAFELDWANLVSKVSEHDGFPAAEGSNLDVSAPYVWNVFDKERAPTEREVPDDVGGLRRNL